MPTNPDPERSPLDHAANAAGKGQLLAAVAWSLVSIAGDLSGLRRDLLHWQRQERRTGG